MFEFWRPLGVGLALCLALGAARAQDAQAPASRLRVVASFSILGDSGQPDRR